MLCQVFSTNGRSIKKTNCHLQETVHPSIIRLQCVAIRSNLTAVSEELASVLEMDSPYSVMTTMGFYDYHFIPMGFLCALGRLLESLWFSGDLSIF